MNDADIKAGSQPASGPPRLLDSLRETMRVRHYSRRTEETYLQWIKRFIVFSGKRHPRELGAAEVTAFLNHLALQRHVAASTQNQALAALLFLYKEVLGEPLPWLDDLVHAKRPIRRPTVLTTDEAQRLLAQMRGPKWLMASLLYGAGLRLRECLTLRVNAPFVCHAPAGKRLRHSHRPGITRTQGCQHHDDLHPRLEQRRPWCSRRSQEQGPHLWGCDGEGARYDCGIIPTRTASSAVSPTG